MLCPCKSDKKFNECCEPIISNKSQAKTPEELMRSRYTAYSVRKSNYIYNTYAKESKKRQSVKDIEQWAQETQWLNLQIIQSSEFLNVQKPTVTFEAIYRANANLHKMTEKSYFIIEDDEWKYVDGSDLDFEELKTPKRNDPCICQSGKKFKKCCGANV